MGYPWTDGDVLTASDLNDIVEKVANNDRTTATTTTTGAWETLKSATVTGGTYKKLFFVWAQGEIYTAPEEPQRVVGQVRITVGGTTKVSTSAEITAHRTTTYAEKVPWSLFVVIESTDADWDPTADVTVTVDGYASTGGDAVSCRSFVIWGI